MLKKLGICLAALLLLCTCAGAEEITVEPITMEIGGNVVSYPQLKGMTDASLQQKINDDIVMSSGVTNHMVTLATLSAPQKLTVQYEVCLLNEDVFSAVISARGRVNGKRDGHVWTALTYDLSNGEKVTIEQLFTDPEKAVAQMEQIAEKTLSDELNGYMEYSEILPLPTDCFTLSDAGITFWYEQEQFSFFSGFSGACQFWYEELDGLWKREEGNLNEEQIRQKVKQSVSEGVIEHIPAAIGDNLQEVNQQYRLLRTPDEFPGGRYFVMEDPRFRQVLVISDALSADYGQSQVEGIQLKRGGFCGLMIGKTSQEDWRKVLGNPEKTVAFTENMAYDYNLPSGEYDVYHYGENELRLHADETGVLCAVQLCK